MAGGIKVNQVDTTVRFDRDFNKLPEEIKEHAKKCIASLLDDPMPSSIRFEKLRGFKNPNIFTIHVTSNHSHKASMEITDGVAILRRIRSHKLIDANP